ncbi:C-C chemokine receptor type 5-like [Sceloporus undulatus]|uniref:C-C chemokine receptor type 5-like n=1 Tax=Sceloporus undulatus TaxID=8520 RepID=UPI001C4C0253|nr:C-C chemokine receptor type 5-like [Sceloporus undulatus]XP_042327068.1 C-C chemokine receptor type 5-like [Sceloporus undulatus]XP_042327069.1 C-C chemokine receptor type 5-like [Sceloporus undulatus]XP_042327070.1 C-C chemokine receptor type 5-like [Sceloporus undulatus]
MNTSIGILDEFTTTFNYDDIIEPVYNTHVNIFTSYFVPPLYSLVFIFGLLGNALVVLILIKYKRLKSMTDIYLLNLAISDLLFIISLPFWIYYVAHEWVFGNEMCKIFSGIYSAGFFSGSFFIILLTVDRYLAIVHAVFALKARTVLYGTLSSVVTWAVAILASIPAFIIYHVQKENEKCKCNFFYPLGKEKEWRQVITLMTFTLGLAIPLVIMVFCYIRIIMVLMNIHNERKRKAVKIIFLIMIVYFILWMPYHIAILLQTYQDVFFSVDKYIDSDGNLRLAIEVTEVIAMIHCCLNPVIYAFVGDKFRKYLCIFFQKHVAVYFCRLYTGRHCSKLERSTSSYISTTEHDISTGL